MLTIKRIQPDCAIWQEEKTRFASMTLCQTPAWLSFLVNTQGGEPVFAELRHNGNLAGYFTGMVVRKLGLRILGSPFPGWSTPYMGFALLPGVSKVDALRALIRFAFQDLHCLHLELMDRELSVAEVHGMGGEYRLFAGFEIDLTQSEEQLFDNMTSACRRCIRKAIKCGVSVEEIDGSDPRFATEYYQQLQDVFAKQRLVPTYSLARVRELISSVNPTGQLLLLRARDAAGHCLATGIFPALNGQRAYFWGMASWRQYQILRPNELLLWSAMKYWKGRGVHSFDMGGSGEYKRKYGGYEISVPWFRISKYPFISQLRVTAQRSVSLKQRLLGRLAGAVRSAPPAQAAEDTSELENRFS